MGLNGISAWQWAVILVVFVLAILIAPGLARSRRAQAGSKSGPMLQEKEASEEE